MTRTRLTPWLLYGVSILLSATFFLSAPVQALVNLSDTQINKALAYGLENQDYGLSTFLGGNWVEGGDGALLNIYTPFMEIARKVVGRKLGHQTTPQAVAAARKKVRGDIDRVWFHPTVKLMTSLYGDTPNFGRQYFARINGVGRGQTVQLYPTKMIQQFQGDLDANAKDKPYTAINTYFFNFEDIARLDEFTLTLYGKGMTPVVFRVNAKDIL